MKSICITLMCLLLVACGEGKKNNEQTGGLQSALPGTTTAKVKPADKVTVKDTVPTDPIAFIKQKVESINTLPSDKKHFEMMCDEKTLVDYFYHDGTLVKISVDYGAIGDVYAKEDYYYDAGKLIFMYEFVEGGPACESCIKKNEYRSYIKDNSVIKYLKDKAVAKCRKCEFALSSKQYKLLSAKNNEEIKAVLCK